MATDYTKIRKWHSSLESDEDKKVLLLIPHGNKLVSVLAGGVNRNLIRGFMSPDDAQSDEKIAAFLASKGYATDALTAIYALSPEQIRANSQVVKGTVSR